MSHRFIPPYPPRLQEVVHHADRLCELIAVHELTPPRDEWAAAWLFGRAEEILDSWRDGHTEEAKARATLEEYMVSLREGLAKHLGVASMTS